MKISYNWLSEYVKTSCTPQELADKLRVSSCEVEDVINWREQFRGLVVGHVLSVAQHPNADRLRIASVDVGTEKKTIVCGAPNLEKGQKVIVALPGTTLKPISGELFTINETFIRGQQSQGMLCAADEIGLPLPSEGIFILDQQAKPGSEVAEALGLADTVLDLEITPNRPDLLSYKGIAREVAALEKKRLVEPPIHPLEEHEARMASPLSASIEDSKLSQRYSAICLNGIKAQPSPLWMQARLLLSGIRPTNLIVDVTNYVMLESGQPLHAFDLDKLLSGKHPHIKVRAALEGELLVTLDGKGRSLQAGDIVIVDSNNKPTALAGIMGGKESEVSDATTSILIESAHFNPVAIRKTARRLGLRSEASSRFEKGLDAEGTVPALKRAVYLLQELSEAKVSSPLIDVYPKVRSERPRIHLSFARIQQVLGVHISAAEAKTILQHLGFQLPTLTKSSFEVVPPSWRKDIEIPEDVIEELIRMWGFERMPLTLPTGELKAPFPNPAISSKQTIRQTLATLKMRECIHLSFTSASAIEKAGFQPEDLLKLPNPLSAETEYLIPNHLIHFLEGMAGVNTRHTELSLFELGRVFPAAGEEIERLSCIWRSSASYEHLYRTAKADIGRLCQNLDVDSPDFQLALSNLPFIAKGSSLAITIGGKPVGELGIIDPAIASRFKVRPGSHILFASMDMAALMELPRLHRLYQSPSPFPSIERDISVIIDASLLADKVSQALGNIDRKNILNDWYITDIYTGKPLAANQKSITIHFLYKSPERTLEDAEVNQHQQTIQETLITSLDATIA